MGRGNKIKKAIAKQEAKEAERALAAQRYAKLQAEDGYEPYAWPRYSVGILDVMLYPYKEPIRGFVFRGELCYIGGALHKMPMGHRSKDKVVLVRPRKVEKFYAADDLWDSRTVEKGSLVPKSTELANQLMAEHPVPPEGVLEDQARRHQEALECEALKLQQDTQLMDRSR